MLFCKIFRFVTYLHFQKYENQNSSINNFIGPFGYKILLPKTEIF
jgi:hypothetical protein